MKSILSILLLFLFGCKVGPNYHEPEIAMPTAFEEQDEEILENEDLSFWWRQFNDPELDALIEEALFTNYDLRIAIEKIEQTRAQYRIEKSHLWPEIDLSGTATRSRISQNLINMPSLPGPAGATSLNLFPEFLNTFQVGFDAIWEFDVWGKFRRSKQAAYDIMEATIDDSKSVMISLVSEVAVNYISLRALQQKLALVKKKIEVDEKELEIAMNLYEVGLDNELQITTLIATIETDRAALPVIETSLKQTLYALAYLLGKQPEGFMDRFASLGPIPSGIDKIPVGLPSELLRRRPDVRSAERQLAAATEKIGAAIADYFPHFGLTGITLGASNQIGSSAGYESNKLNSLLKSASRMFSIGVGLNWDLIDFGRVRGQVDTQKSLQRQALLNYEQTVINSLKDVESALVAYFEEHKRQDSLSQKVDANLRTLEIAKDLFEVGLANEMQVIEAERALIDSQGDLVGSSQALVSDLVGVYKAIGGNWIDPLEPTQNKTTP